MAKRDMEAKGAEIKKLEAQVAEHSRWRDEANHAASVTELEAKKLRANLAEADWEKEHLLKAVQALRELVGPTQKLMASNPELFGGEALGTSRPLPPAIVRLPMIKEEDKERGLNFLRSLLVAPSRPCLLVESPTSALPGIVEVEPSSSQTEGLCMALTGEQVQQMQQAEPVAAPVADTTPVCCVDCGKPKPNYNHPNWPSPITKRFAKHLAKHSGKTDPKTIKTHQDALEFIAKRANVSVETLLKWTINHYWTVVQGSSHHFHMSTGSATWWC
jgi:hypothetical protein